jgi:hypothetical protein
MILNEDEARETVCPFTRNKAHDENCISTMCMAWRWIGTELLGHCGLVPHKVEAERSTCETCRLP